MRFIKISETENLNVDSIDSYEPGSRTLKREQYIEDVPNSGMKRIVPLPPVQETTLKIIKKNGKALWLYGTLANDAIVILKPILKQSK
jgi:hypothetical protein